MRFIVFLVRLYCFKKKEKKSEEKILKTPPVMMSQGNGGQLVNMVVHTCGMFLANALI